MNKKTSLIIGIILIILLGIIGYYFSNKTETINQSLATSTPVASTATSTRSSTDPIHVPFSFKDFFTGEIILNNSSKFSAPGAVISFKLLDDVAHQAANSTYNVYINQNLIGQLGGEGEAIIGFSPDDKYFALRSRFNSGGAVSDQDFLIYVIDLSNSKMLTINPPANQGNVGDYTDTSSFISSVSWNGPDTLKVTYFGVGVDNSDNLYRITPIQIWRYDLASQKYTLVQSLPE